MSYKKHEYFIAIVESGSLTKAAEKLYVSQPSLSQYLKKLETSLGVELFDHNKSPLQLTFTGERYYQYVLQSMKLDENIRKEFQDIKKAERGRLRLGIALWRGACLLPDVFPYFHKHYPGVQIELTEGSASMLENALINDKIDLAIMNLPHNLNYSKLTCQTIFEEPILLAVPSKHHSVRQIIESCNYQGEYPIAPISILNELPLILTKPGQNLTHEIMDMLGKNKLEPKILLETGNLTTAINLVATGIACTFVPGEGAKISNHPEKVTYFALDVPDFKWPLAVVYRKDSYLPQISQLFIQTLKTELSPREETFF